MWVMSNARLEKPTRYVFYIGAVPVALVSFGRVNGKSVAILDVGLGDEERTCHASMSAALREMHRLLGSPPPDGARVGSRGRFSAGEGDEPRPGRGRRDEGEGALEAASLAQEKENAPGHVGGEGSPARIDSEDEGGESR